MFAAIMTDTHLVMDRKMTVRGGREAGPESSAGGIFPLVPSAAASSPFRDPAMIVSRAARWLLVAASIGVVVAAVTYRAFDLDRFFVPKELVLHVAALTLVLLTSAACGRRSIFGGSTCCSCRISRSAP